MRVLTVRQPWAWAIVHGGKDVENRTRNIAGSYRGPVAIHSSLTLHEAATHSSLIVDARIRVVPVDPADRSHDYVFGAVLGVVDLVDAHDTTGDAWLGARCCESPWADGPDLFTKRGAHLVVRDPRPLVEPVRARGRLGLWRPDVDLEAAIVANLPSVGAPPS